MRVNKLTPNQTRNYEGDTRATPYITITLKWEEAQELVTEWDEDPRIPRQTQLAIYEELKGIINE